MSTNYLEELSIWFKGRPLWLQDATRRILEKGVLNEDDYKELEKICMTEVGFEYKDEVPQAMAIPDGALEPKEYSHKVEINSISNTVGINSLNPKNPLQISEGLNIIYGKNGTGKSGYTRLLKQICGAKNLDQLHSNAFEERTETQSCSVRYKHNENEKLLEWSVNEGIHEELSSIELYDSSCGSMYVTKENQLAYEPVLLRLFTQLTTASDQISSQLENVGLRFTSSKPLIPNTYQLTPSSIWYRSLTHKTSEKEILYQCTWSEDNQKNLDVLAVRLKTADPKAEALKIRKSKIQLDKLIAGFENWKTKLSEEKTTAFLASKKDSSAKKLAASEYAKKVFENSPLTGIGEETWNLLWEQARSYSQKVAYSALDFPHVKDEAICVLCQQPLDELSKKRLTDFEGFVKGELELSAKTAQDTFEKSKGEYDKIPDEEKIISFNTAAGLNEEISVKTIALRESIEQSTKSLLGTKEDDIFTLATDFKIIDELILLSTELESTAKQLGEDAKADKREEIREEHLKLESKKWVSQQQEAISTEIKVLERRSKLAKAKSLVNTGTITRKKSLLAEELVTPEYIQRFQEEINQLGAGRIKVKLEKTKSGKGGIYFRIKLDSNKQKLPVDKILSEGEFRIVSLAAFLADVEGRAGKSTFIFDDPISSLDQDYEEKVARRLVDLSKSRQVLVFTHRLSLMALLDEVCKKEKIDQTTIGLSKESWGSGEPGLPPINVQKTKAAINTLIERIPKGRKILDEDGTEEYSFWAKGICSHTRITLEKIIEFDLLADVVQRFRRAVTTQGKLLKVANVTPEDCIYLDELMSKFSRYEHSQPNEVPVPPPEPDELQQDLEQLKIWREEFVDRKV